MLPIELDNSLILTNNYENINSILNQYGVAVYRINDISFEEKKISIDKTKFYNTVNCVLKEEFNVTEPSLQEKLNPSTFKNRKVPDSASGFINQYFTDIHQTIHNSDNFRDCMNYLYNGNVKYLPNRLRITNKTKYDNNSLHIEGINIFDKSENGEISIIPGELAMIVGLSGKRKFVFWDINGKDLKPLYKYYINKGSKEFTKIDFKWMNENYQNCRREVNIDCNDKPILIIWRETTPHEIASSPSLSLFISPTKNFNNNKIKINTLMPKEFDSLTVHQSNLLAMCYNQAGIIWPSGKKTYMFCHQRSISHWLPKIKEYFKENNKMKMRLITIGEIEKNLNFYEGLSSKNIIFPNTYIINNVPNFTIDITRLSNNILIDYGFIEN